MTNLQTLIWKKIEKTENDNFWPSNIIGASLVYVDDTKQYFLIGGNDKLYDNNSTLNGLRKKQKVFHQKQEFFIDVYIFFLIFSYSVE